MKTWAVTRNELKREFASVTIRGARAMQERLWLRQWANEVQAMADRREPVPLDVVRSYLTQFGKRAAYNLRTAANYDLAIAPMAYRGKFRQ